MRIGEHDLDRRVFVIAEIGNNHEGSYALAEELVGLAASAGVDAVKFQTIVPERLVSNDQQDRLRQLKRFELTYGEFEKLHAVSRREGVHFLSTPFDVESAAFLTPLVPAFKIASSDNTFKPLLAVVAEAGKPILLSTGLADSPQIADSKRFIEAIWMRLGTQQELALLHCVTSYPTAPSETGLLAIRYLKDTFATTVGYSDHTLGIQAGVLAVAAGARIVEKHFTIDKHHSAFRDHQLSADPQEMKELVGRIRGTEVMLGRYGKEIQPSERAVVRALRRSIVASRDLGRGHVLGLVDILWLRTADGWSPGDVNSFVGQVLRADLKEGEQIRPDMLANR